MAGPVAPGTGPGRQRRRRRTAVWSRAMVTARSPKTHHHNGNGSARDDAPASRAAVFVDLDRTLLRGASGLVLSAAMHAEGLFEGRRSLPGERLVYGLYDLMGESLAFMAMVRAAPRFTRGWPVEAVCRAGELAAPELVELVQPYAPGVLAEHREAGHLVVLTTTTPADLVDRLRRAAGVRPRARHPLRARRGSLHRRHRGRVRVVHGQARRRAAVGARGQGGPVGQPRLLRQRVRPAPAGRGGASPRREPRPAPARRGPAAALAGGALGPAAGRAQGGRARALRHAPSPGAPRHVPVRALRHRRRGPQSLAGGRSSSPPTTAATSTSWPWPWWRRGSAGRCGSWPRRELFDAPVVGQLARALGGIPVDRGSRSDVALA